MLEGSSAFSHSLDPKQTYSRHGNPMGYMPSTKSSALRWTLLALIAGCLYEAGINIASAIGGGWGFWLVALGFWLPLSIGLWFRLPISRWITLVILWMSVIVMPLGVINPFAAMDELGPNPPPVWKLIAAVVPVMVASLFAIHILGKHKDEFCSPRRGSRNIS